MDTWLERVARSVEVKVFFSFQLTHLATNGRRVNVYLTQLFYNPNVANFVAYKDTKPTLKLLFDFLNFTVKVGDESDVCVEEKERKRERERERERVCECYSLRTE